jgi:beta-lactamase superfamily II metal-dependent hydrolase
VVYFNDILVFSHNEINHIEHLRSVLDVASARTKYAYNSSKHNVTSTTTFEIVYMKPPNHVLDLH